MLASRRLLVSQYHVLMLRHKQTLYLSQRLHSLRLTMLHQPKHLLVHKTTYRNRYHKKKNKNKTKLTKSSNSSFVKPSPNRGGTRKQGLLTPNSGERRNLYKIQIGSRKDLMIRLGSIIGFTLWKTWRQRNLHHVFQRELLCAYLWQAKCTIIRETKVYKAKTMVLTINLG